MIGNKDTESIWRNTPLEDELKNIFGEHLMGCECSFVVRNVRLELGVSKRQPRDLFLYFPQLVRRS